MAVIKICGIKNLSDASFAAGLGVSALGFNFFKKSPRYIEPKDAKEIIAKLPQDIWKVGLFVNHSPSEVIDICEITGIDTLQFHGDETTEFVGAFPNYRKFKAIRVAPDTTATDISRWLSFVDFVLLDSYSKEQFGGTGRSIEEDLLKKFKNEAFWERAFLAGGLTPENVSEAIFNYNPFGVDVASGVESTAGTKETALIKRFVEQSHLRASSK